MVQQDTLYPDYDFVVFMVGAVTYVQDSVRGTYPVVDSTFPENALNSFFGQHSGGNFRLRIQPSVVANNGIVVNVPNGVNMVFTGSPQFRLQAAGVPIVQSWLIGGPLQTAQIAGLHFEGIRIDQMNIVGQTGFNITWIQFRDCPGVFTGAANQQGYIYNSTLGNGIQYVTFSGKTTYSVTGGFCWTLIGNAVGSSHLTAEGPIEVVAGAGTTGFLSYGDGAHAFLMGEIHLMRLDYNKNGAGNDVIFTIPALTGGASSTTFNCFVDYLYYEMHGTNHQIVSLGAYTAGSQLIWSTTIGYLELNNTQSFTWLTNTAAMTWGNTRNSFEVLNGNMGGSSIGTLGAWFQTTSFRVLIQGVVKANPFGKVTNPVGNNVNESSNFISPNGDSSFAGFVASTTYRVGGTACYITWTGGTGVSATVADANGNNVLTAQATGTRQRFEPGYTINFGAFSVAPTVTIDFT